MNWACSVTPVSSTAFQPIAHHLGAVPPKPVPPARRDLSVPFNQFQTPDLPSDHCPGFSTGTAPSQCSAVTLLSTSWVPSIAFVDKLANLNMIIAQLADKFGCLALQSRDSVEFKSQIEELTQENHTLWATVEDHHTAIHELQTTIDTQSASLEELLQVVLIDELRSSGTALPTVKSVNKATKVMCDNVFNVSTQHFINICTYCFPECNPAHILTCDGYFWFQTSNVIGCPQWWFILVQVPDTWCQPSITKLCWIMVRECRMVWGYGPLCSTKACKVFTHLPVKHLKQKTDTDIIKQLKEVFENTRGSIKKGSKGQDMQEVRNHKQWQAARMNCVSISTWYHTLCAFLTTLCTRKTLRDQQLTSEKRQKCMDLSGTGSSKLAIHRLMNPMVVELTAVNLWLNLHQIVR